MRPFVRLTPLSNTPLHSAELQSYSPRNPCELTAQADARCEELPWRPCSLSGRSPARSLQITVHTALGSLQDAAQATRRSDWIGAGSVLH